MTAPLLPQAGDATSPPRPVGPRLDGTAAAMLVLLSVIWGSSYVFVEVILTAVPVVTLVALRVSIAALTLWGIVLVRGIAMPRGIGIWASFAVLGLFNNALPFSLIAWGQTEITAGLAAILNATTPLFTALLAGLLLADEKLSAERILGLLLGLIGVAAMIGPSALTTLGESIFHQLAVLAAAASYAIAAVFSRRYKRIDLAPLAIATGQLTATSTIAIPLALLIDGPGVLHAANTGVWLAIFVNAIIGTALAYLLYFRIMARAGATNTTLVTVLVPIVAVVVGIVTLGERFQMAHLIGMVLIMLGIGVLDGRVRHHIAAKRRTAI